MESVVLEPRTEVSDKTCCSENSLKAGHGGILARFVNRIGRYKLATKEDFCAKQALYTVTKSWGKSQLALMATSWFIVAIVTLATALDSGSPGDCVYLQAPFISSFNYQNTKQISEAYQMCFSFAIGIGYLVSAIGCILFFLMWACCNRKTDIKITSRSNKTETVSMKLDLAQEAFVAVASKLGGADLAGGSDEASISSAGAIRKTSMSVDPGGLRLAWEINLLGCLRMHFSDVFIPVEGLKSISISFHNKELLMRVAKCACKIISCSILMFLFLGYGGEGWFQVIENVIGIGAKAKILEQAMEAGKLVLELAYYYCTRQYHVHVYTLEAAEPFVVSLPAHAALEAFHLAASKIGADEDADEGREGHQSFSSGGCLCFPGMKMTLMPGGVLHTTKQIFLCFQTESRWFVPKHQICKISRSSAFCCNTGINIYIADSWFPFKVKLGKAVSREAFQALMAHLASGPSDRTVQSSSCGTKVEVCTGKGGVYASKKGCCKENEFFVPRQAINLCQTEVGHALLPAIWKLIIVLGIVVYMFASFPGRNLLQLNDGYGFSSSYGPLSSALSLIEPSFIVAFVAVSIIFTVGIVLCGPVHVRLFVRSSWTEGVVLPRAKAKKAFDNIVASIGSFEDDNNITNINRTTCRGTVKMSVQARAVAVQVTAKWLCCIPYWRTEVFVPSTALNCLSSTAYCCDGSISLYVRGHYFPYSFNFRFPGEALAMVRDNFYREGDGDMQETEAYRTTCLRSDALRITAGGMELKQRLGLVICPCFSTNTRTYVPMTSVNWVSRSFGTILTRKLLAGVMLLVGGIYLFLIDQLVGGVLAVVAALPILVELWTRPLHVYIRDGFFPLTAPLWRSASNKAFLEACAHVDAGNRALPTPLVAMDKTSRASAVLQTRIQTGDDTPRQVDVHVVSVPEPGPRLLGCGGCRTQMQLHPSSAPGSFVQCTNCQATLQVPKVAEVAGMPTDADALPAYDAAAPVTVAATPTVAVAPVSVAVADTAAPITAASAPVAAIAFPATQ